MSTDDRPEQKPPSPMDILRDPRALVDTGLGPVAFITVNAIAGLEPAAAVAVGISIAIAVWRGVRREPITNAIGGVLGTGLAVFIALYTGSASGFFVPRAIQNAGLGLAFWGSIVVRRPLVGFFVAPIYHFPPGWHKDPRVRGGHGRVRALLLGPRRRLHVPDPHRQRGGAGRRRGLPRLAGVPGRAVVLLPLHPEAAQADGRRPRRAAAKARALTFACR
jgi:uncharacterized protein DUF3159